MLINDYYYSKASTTGINLMYKIVIKIKSNQ